MPYFQDQNTFLHQSSLLIQAYPTTRITTKYSLPRKPNTHARSPPKSKAKTSTAENATTDTDANAPTQAAREKRERSATLTLKAYHPESGICLKYRTDKAQEVGRLLNGLGRLAKREVIDMPAPSTNLGGGAGGEDKMEIDGAATLKGADDVVTSAPAAVQTVDSSQPASGAGAGGGGAGKGKKKKGKK